MKISNILKVFVLLLLLHLPVVAEEEISLWRTDLIVNEKGDIDVTDTVTMVCNQKKVKRGWFRVFFNEFYLDKNQRFPINFKFQRAFLNGKEHKVSLEHLDKAVKLRFLYSDKPEEMLPVGSHTFVIQYQVSGYKYERPDYDELIWYVTGFSWPLPIKRVETYLQLPELLEPASILRAGFTGNPIAPDHDNIVSRLHEKGVLYTNLEPLAERAGAAVTARFPKDFIKYKQPKIVSLQPDPQPTAATPATNPDGSKNGLVIQTPETHASTQTPKSSVLQESKVTLDLNRFKPEGVSALNSEARLQTNGSLLLTDDLSFQSQQTNQLGITRIIPSSITTADGKIFNLQPQMIQAVLDGQSAEFSVQQMDYGLRVFIYTGGAKNLKPGKHSATLQYQYPAVIEKRKEDDRLALAISGKAGEQGIKSYTFTLHLPELVLATSVPSRFYLIDAAGAKKTLPTTNPSQNSISTRGESLSASSTLSVEAAMIKGFIQ